MKLAELSEDELEQVSGGWVNNGDGTYNLYYVEMFRDGRFIYRVIEDYSNIDLDTFINLIQFSVDKNGNLTMPSTDCKMLLGNLIKMQVY